MFAVELHCHSAHSHDGVDSVEEMLAAAKQAGLDAIAITDHDTIDGSLAAVDLAPKHGVVAIPGIEVSSADGHVLALGVTDLIPRDLSFIETVSRIREAGGTAVVPHPYQELRKGVLATIEEESLQKADAIEVFNSRFLTGWTNRQARAVATNFDMPMTAGSDAHLARMVGMGTTLVDAEERSAKAILTAIENGKTEIDGSRTPFRVTLRQAAGTARRRVRRRFDRVTK